VRARSALFATCKDSGVGEHARNTSSPCWISCLYATVLGPDAGHTGGAITGMSLETLRSAWDRPFLAAEDGGCPALPVPAEAAGSMRQQRAPLSNGARWHGFPGFSVGATSVAAVPTTRSARGVHSLHLKSRTAHSPPRSRIHSLLTNGSSIPAGGAVWPTAIYWSFVEVGTPPVSFPEGRHRLGLGRSRHLGRRLRRLVRHHAAEQGLLRRRLVDLLGDLPVQVLQLVPDVRPQGPDGAVHHLRQAVRGPGEPRRRRPVTVKFGSITEQTTNFDQFKEIDGVMGFTMGGEEDVFSQLVAAGKVENVWAICMKAGSKSNGTLTIGGVDPRLVDGAVRYVPDAGRGFHSVSVKSSRSAAAPTHRRRRSRWARRRSSTRAPTCCCCRPS